MLLILIFLKKIRYEKKFLFLILTALLAMSSCVFIQSHKGTEMTSKPTKIFIFIDGDIAFGANKYYVALLTAFEKEMRELLAQRKIEVEVKSCDPLSLDLPTVAQRRMDAFAPNLVMRIDFKNVSENSWNRHEWA